MTEPRKLRVFLCHAFKDKPIMRDLYELLEAEGWIDPWLDEEKLLPGMDWDMEVEKAVWEADAVIVCLSKNSIVGKKSIPRELSFVINLATESLHRPIFILPMRLDHCPFPRYVEPWQYYDFSIFGDQEQAYKRLVKSLGIKAALDHNPATPDQAAHVLFPWISPEEPSTLPALLSEFEFVNIPRGTFLMGSRAANPLSTDDEIPQTPCRIPYEYWISRFPVTNEQFGEFAVSRKVTDVLVWDWKMKLHQPAVNVSWRDALAYTRWLNEVFGKELGGGLVFRLPTEAEWERAARGDAGREWPWGGETLDKVIDRELADSASRMPENVYGKDLFVSEEVSEFFAKVFKLDKTQLYRVSSTKWLGRGACWKFKPRLGYGELKRRIAYLRAKPDLVDVGSFSPFTDSPFGVGDMMGFIAEWVHSLYKPYPYDAQDGRERQEDAGKRVLRGFPLTRDERLSVRTARRFSAEPGEKDTLLGFRIVLAPRV